MSAIKGRSPFSPGQPIGPEAFTGRGTLVERIRQRGIGQVRAGKSVAMFVQGEYGIGKSSVARYGLSMAQKLGGLLGIYVSLGRAQSMDDFGAEFLEATVQTGVRSHLPEDKIKDWLGRYIKQVKLLGVEIDVKALRDDAGKFTSPRAVLNLLRETLRRLDARGRGVFLILDEINGISANPLFAHFLKDLIDINAIDDDPVPLLLMLCGTEARRFDLIRSHRPVDRIFDVLSVGPMADGEIREFYEAAFRSAQMTIDPAALDLFVHYSGGLPKVMHEIGDAAYFLDLDAKVDLDDARKAIEQAAFEVGRKYVEPEVVDALKSRSYRSLLDKLASIEGDEFTRDALVAESTDDEARKVDNFLRRLKKLNVIRPGESPGEYAFNVRMFHAYLSLRRLDR